MRFVLLSDIHGNFIALEAVLNDLAGEQIDQFICLGDVAEAGPTAVACRRTAARSGLLWR